MSRIPGFRTATLALIALLAGEALAQTTHDVMVLDNSFSPSSLTIAPGDTVRWTNGAGGNPHDVTSDTGAWAPSATASSFVFEVTFDDPGEFPYKCTVHPAQMTGTITVESDEPAFVINPGLNDAWFNAATAGQGFFFNIFPVQQLIFMSWFTFDTERPPEDIEAILGEPGHRWVTALGSWEGNVATLNAELTTGGLFDSEEPAVVQTPGYGTFTIEFHDCENATLMYNLPGPGVMGTIELTRVTPDNVALCQALAEEG